MFRINNSGIQPTCARISKDSRLIGVGYNSNANNSKVYDYSTLGQTFKTFTAGDIILDLDFNFNTTLFAVTGNEKSFRVWNIAA